MMPPLRFAVPGLIYEACQPLHSSCVLLGGMRADVRAATDCQAAGPVSWRCAT